MERLAILTNEPVESLIDKYELVMTDLSNHYKELTTVQSDNHTSYLESYARSKGKSVSERNRDADYENMHGYRSAIELKGQIDELLVTKELLINLINWKLSERNSNGR